MGNLCPVVQSRQDPRDNWEAQSSRALVMAWEGSTCPALNPLQSSRREWTAPHWTPLKSQPGSWAQAPGAQFQVCWWGVTVPLRCASCGHSGEATHSLCYTSSMGVEDIPARGRWSSLLTGRKLWWVYFVKKEDPFAEEIVREPNFVFSDYEFWHPNLFWFSVGCHPLVFPCGHQWKVMKGY